MGRWGSGEVGRWGIGEVGKWGSGEVGKWGSGEAVSSPYHPKTLSPYLLTPDSTNKLFQQTLFNLTTPLDR
ncbi:MAG: hypothetical protein EWV91_11470 [Microcystis aeruginosa Ma_QC_Ca_00000000_S207]|uniref:Uncharacterized protein n=1 Tax=Microcystis aeruginosa Ma_QC_Ca_00000000_S207 TaxID=2486251 RepID=A0A552FKE9_MICAE|nr:MAG: hypothetical protein EWV91_11470 [Microcystis aeruginosa Ma_QC_Ca_00000000_S207]